MNKEEYIKQRLEDQINWYDKKSQWNQRLYKSLKAVKIMLAILIPWKKLSFMINTHYTSVNQRKSKEGIKWGLLRTFGSFVLI